MKPIYAGLSDGGLPFHMTFDRFYLVGSPFAYVAHPLAALEAMNKALDFDSRSVAGWYNRGMILDKYSRYDDAERDLLQARELAPDRPEIVVMLQAVNLARRGRPR